MTAVSRRTGPAADGTGDTREDADIPADAEAPADGAARPADGDVPVLLLEPAEGLPPVVADPVALDDAVRRLAGGRGPVALDAERASGFRYGQRAFLVQLRRADAGTVLIDPVACPDLTALDAAIADSEWVLHAASQDLPCLRELGMRPRNLFDTELAGRLAGFPRVGLATLLEQLLGVSLEKGHSAADWSTRPLPEPWLRYAALDVELLVELRNALEGELAGQGKLAWAHEEFAALATAPPPAPRTDPWRRISGLHRVRGRRQLAAARAMWTARDELARRRDVAPGRVLPDSALIAAVLADPRDRAAITALPVFGGPRQRRVADTWLRALADARALPDQELPPVAERRTGPPSGNRWADRDPEAAARLTAARTALQAIAAAHTLPVENLVEPALVRQIAWEPPRAASGAPADAAEVAARLHSDGARPWQVDLVADALAEALTGRSLTVVTGGEPVGPATAPPGPGTPAAGTSADRGDAA